MTGASMFATGIYTIVMAAFGIEPSVFGGMIIAGLGLVCMIISSRRGDHD